MDVFVVEGISMQQAAPIMNSRCTGKGLKLCGCSPYKHFEPVTEVFMPLLRILLLAFPLLELASLIVLGQEVGVGWTLFWVLFTGVAGLMLIQRSGWGMLQRLQQQMLVNRSPQAVLKSGMWGVLAGVLLAFPGLVSDALAVPCLIMMLLHRGGGSGPDDDSGGGPRTYRQGEFTIIEGEWQAGDPQQPEDPGRLNRP